ncbi:IS3 family transposase [Weissella coleopterorum]|uniref:IS3 family transposase n=1 Tax=Weissella coleopterorum TaxID=2714949 RepID=A0A6G8B1W7_9LACO|nr:IS3 family transposase [Weissella coleopterorum]
MFKREFVYLTKFQSYDDLILKIEIYMYWYNHHKVRTAV